jgi:acylpyruvate hydrolase
MKLLSFVTSSGPRLGLVDGDTVLDINAAIPDVPSDLRTALAAGVALQEVATLVLSSGVARIPLLGGIHHAPVVPTPGKTICLGLNYFDHATEGGRARPEYPWLFFRGATSLLGHGEAGRVPRVSAQFDFEAELAVIIATTVPRHTSPADALQYVFGYSCFNDMSVRDYQKRTPQWTIGKNFDATGGFGPVVVTADELPLGAVGLQIEGRLNDEVMQRASTGDMIFGVAETVSMLSEVLTLEAGDVLAMGTPAGVGQARSPQRWMKRGDVYEVTIEGIGTLSNPILDEDD